MQVAPTWWLVKASPSEETKEPEPPLLKRTEESCTCCSQGLVSSNPYLTLIWAVGGKLNSHMPSSAAATPARLRTRNTIGIQRRMASPAVRSSPDFRESRSLALQDRPGAKSARRSG